jgi:hypothetical protein
MSLENLKSKLHVIFENCSMQHEDIAIKENNIPPQEQEYKDAAGIVYKISFDGTNYNVKDQTGNQKDTFTLQQKDTDGGVTKNVRAGIVTQLTPEASPQPTAPVKPEQPTTPSQPTQAQEPVEAPVAEQKLP